MIQLASIPIVPWQVEATSHLAYIDEQVEKAAIFAFPKIPIKKWSLFLSSDTFNLIF